MKLVNTRPIIYRTFFAILALAVVLYGQQCARVPLQKVESIPFASLGDNPLRVMPPIEYTPHRKIVFLVDMSQSMISGPCPQDIDSQTPLNPPYVLYDPTKNAYAPAQSDTGDLNDHRASGVDCKINRNLPQRMNSLELENIDLTKNPQVFLETFLGLDPQADRLTMIRSWLKAAIEDGAPFAQQRTEIMILPVSGGVSQKRLLANWTEVVGGPSAYKFLPLNDPKLEGALNWLQSEHARNLQLSESNEIYRYENRSMGTTAPGGVLPDLYTAIQNDMRKQNGAGLLATTEYQVIAVSDGLVTPQEIHVIKGLGLYPPCNVCMQDPKRCLSPTLSPAPVICSNYLQSFLDAWGDYEINKADKLDFYYGLLEALPKFFGAGNLRLDFVDLKPNLRRQIYGENNILDELEDTFRARGSRLVRWPANTATPPMSLIGSLTKNVSYKMTHLFILNNNARYAKTGVISFDADGDGLFDYEETTLNSNPYNPRSNGFCLDSFLHNSAFRPRCLAYQSTRSCDPTLDSDGDTLNECEELLLGTDTFDFDTDGDGLPDSLEWLYGYNPVVDDTSLDSNADGFTNMTNFSAGLPPEVRLNSVSESQQVRFKMNFLGKESLQDPAVGNVEVDLYEVKILGVPILNLAQQPLVQDGDLYLSKSALDPTAREKNYIFPDQRLIGPAEPQAGGNQITVLARIVDRADASKVYWRIYKEAINQQKIESQPYLDLSQLKLIRARDRNLQ